MKFRTLILSFLLALSYVNLYGSQILPNDQTYSIKEFYKLYDNYSITDTLIIRQYLDLADEIIQSSDDLEELYYASLLLGSYYDLEIHYEKAINYYYSSIDFAKQLNKKNEEAIVYDKLANVYKIYGNDQLITQCIQNAIDLKRSIGDSIGVYRSKLRLCKFYRNSGKYLSAFEIAFKALEFGESMDNSVLVASAYNSIGVAYKDLKDYDKSLMYLNKSIELYEELGIEYKYAMLLNNIGIIYWKTEQYQLALDYLNNSLSIDKRLNRKGAVLRNYNNIGLVYAFIGNNDAAINMFMDCIKEYSRIGESVKLANLYNSLGTCYSKKQELDSAIYYQSLSFDLSERNGYEKLYLSSSLELSELYEMLGDLENAYLYMKKYSDMNSELEKFNKDITMLSTEFEYIMARNNKMRKMEAENRILRNILIFVILGVILVFSGYFARRFYTKYNISKRSIENLENKIEGLRYKNNQKDKELATKLLQLINHNTEKELLVKKLTKLKADVGLNSKSKIQELINEINLKIDKDLWKEFELRFINIHSDFYNKLLSENPGLTQGEKRLCSLLFLNFSPKEISLITKHSYRSILVAKYRLKNKLQLSNTEELTNFLNQLV